MVLFGPNWFRKEPLLNGSLLIFQNICFFERFKSNYYGKVEKQVLEHSLWMFINTSLQTRKVLKRSASEEHRVRPMDLLARHKHNINNYEGENLPLKP